MSDKKISQLPTATTISITDSFPLVQSSGTTQCSVAQLFAAVPVPIVVSQMAESPSSGALSTAIQTSFVTSSSGITNYSLAVGTNGMTKTIAVQTIGSTGSVVLTITGDVGANTITFNAIGQTASLKCIGTSWFVTSVGGKTLPVIA
jgi:hypothetical protein